MKEEKYYKNLPKSPGVYLMKDKKDEVIYVGKAANLKERVKSYFIKNKNRKTKKLVKEINKIDFKKTDSVVEALILESKLIKKYKPFFNVKEKDNRSFLYVAITDEKFPRVILIRGRNKDQISGELFGPFTSSSSIREALRIIRKIFPYSLHKENKIGTYKRPCMDYQIGLCPGTCVGKADKNEYMENIKNIKKLFKGKKESIIKELKKRMKKTAKDKRYEKAGKIKKQISALQHIQDIALIKKEDIKNINKNKDKRIEGYDISNISGKLASGSMVVFNGKKPNKNEYRKFKIRTVKKANDVAMIKEVLERRFKNSWPLPDLILVDGGKPQVNIAKSVLEKEGLGIPVVGIAKGEKRKKNEIIGDKKDFDKKTLIKVRDEAHRFALKYHKKLRQKEMTQS